jgi:hypothetical protein
MTFLQMSSTLHLEMHRGHRLVGVFRRAPRVRRTRMRRWTCTVQARWLGIFECTGNSYVYSKVRGYSKSTAALSHPHCPKCHLCNEVSVWNSNFSKFSNIFQPDMLQQNIKSHFKLGAIRLMSSHCEAFLTTSSMSWPSTSSLFVSSVIIFDKFIFIILNLVFVNLKIKKIKRFFFKLHLRTNIYSIFYWITTPAPQVIIFCTENTNSLW